MIPKEVATHRLRMAALEGTMIPDSLMEIIHSHTHGHISGILKQTHKDLSAPLHEPKGLEDNLYSKSS